jgi:hypothetical protein
LMITNFDSERQLTVPHTGFTDPSVPASAPPRKSIEVRVVVFYEAAVAQHLTVDRGTVLAPTNNSLFVGANAKYYFAYKFKRTPPIVICDSPLTAERFAALLNTDLIFSTFKSTALRPSPRPSSASTNLSNAFSSGRTVLPSLS